MILLKKILKCKIQFFTFIILTNLAISKDASQELVTLHEEVGPVIDAEENDRYHLFSQDVGLIAAKLYHRSPDKWILHLLGEKDGKPWMIVRNINMETKNKLANRIRTYLSKKGSGKLSQNSYSIYVIELPTEVSANRPLQVKLVDNTKLFGTITGCSTDALKFVTLSGLHITIPESQILEVKWPEGRFVDGSFERYDPNHNRLFFGPTGRTLRAGELNFADFYVVFPTLAVGLTDFFMIGGGVSLFPGAESQLLYFSPKIRLIHGENFDLAAGILYMGVPNEGDLGAAYTSVSIGNPRRGLTFGFAVPFATEDTDSDFYAFLFGGEIQISNSAKLITENWFLTGYDDELLILSGGVRFFGERLSVDIGLFTSPEFFNEDGFPFIPWLDFAVSFGK